MKNNNFKLMFFLLIINQSNSKIEINKNKILNYSILATILGVCAYNIKKNSFKTRNLKKNNYDESKAIENKKTIKEFFKVADEINAIEDIGSFSEILNNLLDENNLYKSFIFEGPPGTGKSLIAQLYAYKKKSKIITITFDFLNKYKLSDIFDVANDLSTKGEKIVFLFDEADAYFNNEETEDLKFFRNLLYENKNLNNFKFFLTTNNVNSIDEFILTSSINLNFPNLSTDQIESAIVGFITGRYINFFLKNINLNEIKKINIMKKSKILPNFFKLKNDKIVYFHNYENDKKLGILTGIQNLSNSASFAQIETIFLNELIFFSFSKENCFYYFSKNINNKNYKNQYNRTFLHKNNVFVKTIIPSFPFLNKKINNISEYIKYVIKNDFKTYEDAFNLKYPNEEVIKKFNQDLIKILFNNEDIKNLLGSNYDVVLRTFTDTATCSSSIMTQYLKKEINKLKIKNNLKEAEINNLIKISTNELLNILNDSFVEMTGVNISEKEKIYYLNSFDNIFKNILLKDVKTNEEKLNIFNRLNKKKLINCSRKQTISINIEKFYYDKKTYDKKANEYQISNIFIFISKIINNDLEDIGSFEKNLLEIIYNKGIFIANENKIINIESIIQNETNKLNAFNFILIDESIIDVLIKNNQNIGYIFDLIENSDKNLIILIKGNKKYFLLRNKNDSKEKRQTLNILLTKLDNFKIKNNKNKFTFLFFYENNFDIKNHLNANNSNIDSALIRPGRFLKKIQI